MDPHCPWVNNCVGANNQKHFVLFVGYTALLCLCALILLGCRLASGVSENAPPNIRGRRIADPSTGFLYLCLLFFEAILFGLFTAAMLCEQVTSSPSLKPYPPRP